MRLETKYARSGNVSIAYQVVGDGPLDLVYVSGWVSHLEAGWEQPLFARFLSRLASFSRLIIFDKRGTGLSDRTADLPTLEQRMDDVRAVMDAVGSEHAALLGVSEGAPMCALFAATYPERTVALLMFGGYARRLWAPDHPWGVKREVRDRFVEGIEREWGGPVGLSARAPSLLYDEGFRTWYAKFLRMSASPGAVVDLTRMNDECDVAGDDIGGVAVEMAAHVASLASSDEHLVSNTVRDLVAGSGIEFEEIGNHPFRGLPGDSRLFRVVREQESTRVPPVRVAADVAVADRHQMPLSPQEWKIAYLLTLGLTTHQIGNELGFADGTVNRHVANIFNKLGYRSRSQIAAWATAQGLSRRQPN